MAEGGSLSFTVSATDEDGDALTYSRRPASRGDASFDTDTRAFSWSPGYRQSGIYDVTFSVTDDGKPSSVDRRRSPSRSTTSTALPSSTRSATSPSTKTARSPSPSPRPTSTGRAEAQRLGPARRRVVRGRFVLLEPGLLRRGHVRGHVLGGRRGGVRLGDDHDHGQQRQPAPVLDPIGDRSVYEGATLSFTLSATDADRETLTFSATGLPTGATFDSGHRRVRVDSRVQGQAGPTRSPSR